METRLILNKRISFCPNARAKSYRTITLFDALNSIRTQVYENQIAIIRELSATGSIISCHAKKKQLPSFVFSGQLFDTRYKFDISGYTSLLIIDIDQIDDIEATISILKSDIHIVSVWRSPSGKGLKALLHLEYTEPIDNENIWIVHEYCAFPQVANYLAEKYSIQVDKTGADITRLCFVSSDPEIHLKRKFEPFPVTPNLNKKQIWEIKRKYYYGKKDVRDAIIEMKQIAKQTTVCTTPTVTSIDNGEFCGGLITDLQTKNKCIELARILSRVRQHITNVEYESAEQLILSSQEAFTTIKEIVADDISKAIINNLTVYFTEIHSLLAYLKSIQWNPANGDKDLCFRTNLLPFDLKMTFLNNLRNKVQFQSIISEIKYGINPNEINKREELIKKAVFLARKKFARGCYFLKKWAQQQLMTIDT